MHGKRKNNAGFTLIELMIVMLIVGVLMMVAIPLYKSSLRLARESVLKQDLQVMRNAIDAFTEDKLKAPQSLDDLVQEGYLKSLPVDPMTHSTQTWTTDATDALHSVDQSEAGLGDVHSGSVEVGSDGQPYSAW